MILKTKKLIYLALILLTSALHAEWATITLQEQVDRASGIVVVEFEKELMRKETAIGEEQLVLFNILENIKGDLNGSIEVKGQAFEMCMAQMFFENIPKGSKYLLFLEQEANETKYSLVHGDRSALSISEDFVAWIVNQEKIDLGDLLPTAMKEVKKEISELMKNKEEE